jgi:hypothetical protein
MRQSSHSIMMPGKDMPRLDRAARNKQTPKRMPPAR